MTELNQILLDAFERIGHWVKLGPAKPIQVTYQGKNHFIAGRPEVLEECYGEPPSSDMQADSSLLSLHTTSLEGELGVPVQAQGSGTWVKIR